MRKNKYATDFRQYMSANIKRDMDIEPVSLGIWDKKLLVSSAEPFRNIITKPTVHRQETLLEFAAELRLPIHLLIEQFDNAGIPHLTPEVIISDHHKTALLDHLRKEHATNEHKIRPLKRTEVRKKRVLVGENQLLAPLTTDTLYQNTSPSSDTIILLEEINDQLMLLIAKNPLLMYQLGHRKFEEFIAKLFADLGHEVSLTPKTRDGGFDLFAKVKNDFSEFIILAECKKYSPDNKVGVEIVRGLYGVVEEHKANQGIIITSSFFTKEAQQTQLRIGNRMALKDYNDLVKWIKPYSKNV